VFGSLFRSQGGLARFEPPPESARDGDWCALSRHYAPKPRTPPPPPRADSAQAAAADMRLRKRLRELPRSVDPQVRQFSA